MAWMRNKKAQHIVEYAMLFAITVAALTGMSLYLRNSIAGKWRQTADGFGHGRLYQVEAEEEIPEEPVCSSISWKMYTCAAAYKGDGSASNLYQSHKDHLVGCSYANPTDWGQLNVDTKINASYGSGCFKFKWKGCGYDWRWCTVSIVN